MTLELAEIADIRRQHQSDQRAESHCLKCRDQRWPCDTAKVLAAFDDEIAAHVFSGKLPGNRRRRRARAARSAKRGR